MEKRYLEEYHEMDYDYWGMNRQELTEIESKFRYYCERFHVDNRNQEKCNEQARAEANEELSHCEKPLGMMTRIIARYRMVTLMDRICMIYHLNPCDFVITMSGRDSDFDVGMQYKWKRIEDIKGDMLEYITHK